MTSHEVVADSLFLAGGTLLLVKFWTWEDAKHESHRRTAALLAGVTLFVLVLSAGFCWMTYSFNKPKSSTAEVSKTAPLRLTESQQSEIAHHPLPPENSVSHSLLVKRHTGVNPVASVSKPAVLASPSVTTPPPVVAPASQQCAVGSQCNSAMPGGTIDHPTVNNFAPPTRHIPSSTQLSLVECLSKNPGTVEIMAPVNDAEAFSLASEWLDVFDKAHWKFDPKMIRSYTMSGAVQTGTSIHISGSINPDGTNPKFDAATPGGSIVGCVVGKQSDGSTTMTPYPDMAKEHVLVWVGVRPVK